MMFKIGFYEKFASMGYSVSDVDELLVKYSQSHPMEKDAAFLTVPAMLTALGLGASGISNLAGAGLKGLGAGIKGLGTAGLLLSLGGGALGGGALAKLTSPSKLSMKAMQEQAQIDMLEQATKRMRRQKRRQEEAELGV